MQGQNDERDFETLLNLLRHQNSTLIFLHLKKSKLKLNIYFLNFKKI